ncbi:MAG: cation-translocating P-type ATPase [Bdellovibrionales bacterium]|nr:cation-translocating P-type ATPase [Oligoflexia bacterium]
MIHELEMGLSNEEVAKRKLQFGLNEILNEKSSSPWTILISQFKSPLVFILIAACILSAVLDGWLEASAIGMVLILNAIMGFFQEFHAEKAVLALKDMTAPHATVIRSGQQSIIAAVDIVPGDLLLLEAGDVVAADAKILKSAHLQVNEAVLTGESLPVEKQADQTMSVFMGTSVATGTGKVEVTSTGMSTKLGKIARLITTADSPKTPLQLQLLKVGSALLLICLVVIAFVVLLGWIHHRPWVELIIFSISLAVAVVPEGMPAIITIALSLGVRKMALENALVRKLPSVETLGSVSVICTDKTGTLTTGVMRVREVSSSDIRSTLIAAVSCCDAILEPDGVSGTGDSTELAILIEAARQGIFKLEIEKQNPRILDHPFDSIRKRMSVQRKDGVLYVKGAFESVIPACTGLEHKMSELNAINEEMTSRGLRILVIASGKQSEEKDLTYLGIIAIADPPREEVKQAIAEARQAGIRIVMITGDHPNTAAAIARELGILQAGDKVEDFVHARATPEEKLKIIRDWKERGAIVAMTGDGVNDAPALREAHIGIAMGKTGTEVTRQAADLILADDHFSTIILAVKEGRGIYQNIRKAIVFLLTGNWGELVAVVGASLLNLPLPFLAVHLLWINLVTDSLPAIALIADPASSDAMNLPPRPSKELLLGRSEWQWIGWVGALEGGTLLAFFFYLFKNGGLEHARNLAFPTLVLSQLWRSLSARSRSKTIIETGFKSNLWLIAVIMGTGIIQLGLHFFPPAQSIFKLQNLKFSDLGAIILVSLITFFVIEARKLVVRRIHTAPLPQKERTT